MGQGCSLLDVMFHINNNDNNNNELELNTCIKKKLCHVLCYLCLGNLTCVLSVHTTYENSLVIRLICVKTFSTDRNNVDIATVLIYPFFVVYNVSHVLLYNTSGCFFGRTSLKPSGQLSGSSHINSKDDMLDRHIYRY